MEELLILEEEQAIETQEMVETEPRTFMTTAFDEYTVTEGLLLVIALLILGTSLVSWIRSKV